MIGITGATGQLGRLVVEALLKKVPAASLVAIVRNPDAAADMAAQGVTVRQADYDKPETLGPALAGVEKLLLISGNEVGRRLPQHTAIIEAAKKASVKFVAYTSILKADRSELSLAVEHKATEDELRASGLGFCFLRNGWYNENYAGSIPMALEHGAVIGSAGDGRFSTASRRDYAEAAAAVLTTGEDQSGKIYELAGDTSFTLAELAAEIAKQSGKPVSHADMPEADYAAALQGAGLPPPFAAMLANSDVGASKGWLFDDSHTLSGLTGHPTMPMGETVAAVLKG